MNQLRRLADGFRENLYLTAALLAAGITAVLVFNFFDSLQQRADIVVAVRDLPEHTRLDKTHLRTVSVEASSRHPQSIARPEEAVGAFVLQKVAAGEPIFKTRLSTSERFSTVVGEVEKDRRAMFVPSNISRGVGGLIKPRQRVDLVFVANEQKTGTPMAKLFLQNLLVLDVRNDRGSTFDEADREASFAGAVLSVSPFEAERIAYALEYGQIYIVTAGFESQTVSTSGAGLTAVLSDSGGGRP